MYRRMFRCRTINYPTIAIWNCFIAWWAKFWLVRWMCILKMHFWLEIKCQTECNNDNDKNKGHAYRFFGYLTFSFLTSNWNNYITILHFLRDIIIFYRAVKGPGARAKIELGQPKTSVSQRTQGPSDPSLPTIILFSLLPVRSETQRTIKA